MVPAGTPRSKAPLELVFTEPLPTFTVAPGIGSFVWRSTTTPVIRVELLLLPPPPPPPPHPTIPEPRTTAAASARRSRAQRSHPIIRLLRPTSHRRLPPATNSQPSAP